MMITEARFAWLLLVLFTSCAETPPAKSEALQEPRGVGPTIRRMEAVDDLDEIEPGKFDATLVKRVYAPQLNDCSTGIAAASLEWGGANHLGVLRQELEDRRVQIHLGPLTGSKGFFEVLYRLDPTKHRAAISFTFLDANGTSLEPSTQLSTAEDLATRLAQLITCQSKAGSP